MAFVFCAIQDGGNALAFAKRGYKLVTFGGMLEIENTLIFASN